MSGRPVAATRGGRTVAVTATLLLLLAALLLATGRPALAGPAAGSGAMWPDDRFHRVAALALIEQLRASLLTEASATLTLERWCGAHRIGTDATAGDAQVIAVPDPGHAAPPDDAQRALLAIAPDETVRYRHVQLFCRGVLLSDADNWYVPSRLTPDMNRLLDTTRTPFGKVIAALGFTRATLSSELAWSPLPADWAMDGTADRATNGATGRSRPTATPARPLVIPATLIRNRALLHNRNGQPLALLVERYRSGILAFPPPLP